MATREDAIYFLEEFKKNRPPVMSFDLMDTGVQFILKYLYDHAGQEVSAGKLAEELHVTTARIAKALQTGEEKGWLLRTQKASDRRVTVVRLLPLGEKKVEEKREEFISNMQKMLDTVGKEDMQQFLDTLKKMKEILML